MNALTPAARQRAHFATRSEKTHADGSEFFRKYVRGLGVPKEIIEEVHSALNLFANQQTAALESQKAALELAAERRRGSERSKLMRAERRRLRSEAQRADAEAQRAGAEAQRADAEAQRADTEKRFREAAVEATKASSLARQRYLELITLRGTVDLREELKKIQQVYAEDLIEYYRSRKLAAPSREEQWQHIFRHGEEQILAFPDRKGEGETFGQCFRKSGEYVNSAEKSGRGMARIFSNLNKKFHRSRSADEIDRVGGVPIEESDLLPLEDCRLIECVLRYAKIPAGIVLREENSMLPSERSITNSS